MKPRIVFSSIIALVFACGLALAEKVDLPGEAEQKSTHILTGTVSTVYAKETSNEKFVTANYVAEVRVESVEKGEGIKPGQVAYVRYWRNLKWLGQGPQEPGPSGHANQPKEGEKRRICLVRSADGAFDVYYVGGFKNVGEKDPEK